MSTGIVKWFNPTKGYGFVKSEENGQDVFIHITALKEIGLDTLEEGQRISYEIATNKGKTSAVSIEVL
ncbi:MAG: cold shock domain-containing protein [Rickettsiaceae bacterium]|nr:cold shock domain-containing protein [Rickettsiaceae bacterium]